MAEPSNRKSPSKSAASSRNSRAITLSPAAWAALGVVIAALFGCISASLTALVPEIGQTLRPVFSQPASPIPAPSILPDSQASHPSASILRPLFTDGPVPVQTNLLIEYDSIPEGRYLWVVVRIPKVRPTWVVYPQLLNGIPEPVTGKGTLETSVQLGLPGKEIGDPFNVVLLLLDEEANRSFVEYSRKCINNSPDCVGIQLPASGVEILDFNTLVRK